MGIEVLVVLARTKGAILFRDKEEQGCLGGLGWNNMSSFQMFFNECLTGLHFLGVEWVYLGDFWSEARFKVNDVVVWMMRWEFFMGFL